MDEQIREQPSVSLLSTILFIVKSNLLLMIIITVLCTCVGLGYSILQKPDYTASEKVIYKAQNTVDEGNNIINNINAMNAFVSTIVDFVDEGVVIDRANEYYKNYLNSKQSDAELTVEEYIQSLKVSDSYTGRYLGDKYYIFASNISVSYTAKANDMKFSFSVKYTDKDKVAAVEKLKILVYATDVESRAIDKDGNNAYFDGITNELVDFDTESVASSMSKKTVVLVAFLVGIVLACVVTYVRFVMDRTVTTKDELQELTGGDVLAQVCYKEV